MKFKCIQTFSPEYLKQCRKMTADGILQFLDDFSKLHTASLNPLSKKHHATPLNVVDVNSIDRSVQKTHYKKNPKN